MNLILVATDGSDSASAAARVALELAAASGDRLLFVTAWRELRGDFGIPLHHLIPDLIEIERDWAKRPSSPQLPRPRQPASRPRRSAATARRSKRSAQSPASAGRE